MTHNKRNTRRKSRAEQKKTKDAARKEVIDLKQGCHWPEANEGA